MLFRSSDPAAPEIEADVSIDGTFVDSRRIGDTVYIVSRYVPSVEGLVYYVSSAAERAQNEALLANVSLDELLPTITIDGNTRALVQPNQCFVTTDGADTGSALGWVVREYDGETYVQCAGHAPGFTAALVVRPRDGTVAAVMATRKRIHLGCIGSPRCR